MEAMLRLAARQGIKPRIELLLHPQVETDSGGDDDSGVDGREELLRNGGAAQASIADDPAVVDGYNLDGPGPAMAQRVSHRGPPRRDLPQSSDTGRSAYPHQTIGIVTDLNDEPVFASKIVGRSHHRIVIVQDLIHKQF
jgi:hypothetical protein